MELPPPPPASNAGDIRPYSLPPLPHSKLRLMCSYGGHIVPRPDDKSLFYAGGDTRIVAVDRRTTGSSLFSLLSHLSRTLYNNRPFALKYQLPNEDLDSLISITTDEDLHNMLEEHDRIVSSPTPSRIRLFLFPSKPESVGSVLLDPKSESWFCDALKSTMIINRGLSAESGLVNGLMGLCVSGQPDSSLVEAQGESLGTGVEGKQGCDSGSVPESVALETCSSFGSTGSSVSLSNLPPLGVHGEDVGFNLQDKKVNKVASSGSIESDSAASAASLPRIGIQQDHLLHSPPSDTKFSSNNAFESESIIYDPSSAIQMQRIHQVSGSQLPHLPNQKPDQEFQYINGGFQYIQQYSMGPVLASSYYPIYRPYHPQTLPYPIYLVPVRANSQRYNVPIAHDLHENVTSLGPPPMHPNPTDNAVTPRVPYRETVAPQPTPPERIAEFYLARPPRTLPDNVPLNQHQEPITVPQELLHVSQSVAAVSTASTSFSTEYENDLAYAQIYKSQPTAPALLPKYQTIAKAATVLLSEPTVQLDADIVRQQGSVPQPQ